MFENFTQRPSSPEVLLILSCWMVQIILCSAGDLHGCTSDSPIFAIRDGSIVVISGLKEFHFIKRSLIILTGTITIQYHFIDCFSNSFMKRNNFLLLPNRELSIFKATSL